MCSRCSYRGCAHHEDNRSAHGDHAAVMSQVAQGGHLFLCHLRPPVPALGEYEKNDHSPATRRQRAKRCAWRPSRRLGGARQQRRQSFQIEVPYDNSWPLGGNHGESQLVTRADASRSEAQTRRSQAYDRRFSGGQGRGRTADLPIFSRSFEWIHLKNPAEVFVPGNIVDSDVRVS
jgi:hypothetical protein